ncbi:E3 ubiquitin-protein ligase TRIM56-like [Babylonia areolata]|uniref:E3 ubiquitin-protein ligase TRIM56-like n=1 Tax=Babylonia areolata TaxID=304850 RepID=UPI003FD4BA7A
MNQMPSDQRAPDTQDPTEDGTHDNTMASASSDYECPVCHDDYIDPKILPCGHLVCQSCVLSWLDKEGRQACCPLCRASIISPNAAGPADFAAEVNALPTDLHTTALVESHKILRGPHVCGLCENNFAAVFFCIQCMVKLCTNCEKGHRKIPALKRHILEDVNNLNVESLARSGQVMCKAHPDRLAELYCPVHEEVMCSVCSTTSHGACAAMKILADMATDTRAELNQRAQKLRTKESKMVKRLKSAKDHFQSMHKKGRDIFDDLHKALDAHHQKLTSIIQAQEDDCMKSLGVTKTGAALTQNATAVERVAQSASEGSLLQMRQSLRARLDDLEKQSDRPVK